MNEVFGYKTGAHLSGDPQVIGEALLRVRETSGAGFSNHAVVEAARDETSPLHPLVFDCSIEEAAEYHWEERAGYLIRSVVVFYKDAEHVKRQTNAWVSVTERETQEIRYLPIFTAMTDEDYREQIVGRCLSDLLAIRHKYAEMKEFARVFSAIDAAAKRFHKGAAA